MIIQAIKEEVQKLNKEEQADLMHFMVELLTSEEPVLSEEWKTELDRREAALQLRESKGKPARAVIAKYKAN